MNFMDKEEQSEVEKKYEGYSEHLSGAFWIIVKALLFGYVILDIAKWMYNSLVK